MSFKQIHFFPQLFPDQWPLPSSTLCPLFLFCHTSSWVCPAYICGFPLESGRLTRGYILKDSISFCSNSLARNRTHSHLPSPCCSLVCISLHRFHTYCHSLELHVQLPNCVHKTPISYNHQPLMAAPLFPNYLPQWCLTVENKIVI